MKMGVSDHCTVINNNITASTFNILNYCDLIKEQWLGKKHIKFYWYEQTVSFTFSTLTDAASICNTCVLPEDLVHANGSKWLAPHTANDCGKWGVCSFHQLQ